MTTNETTDTTETTNTTELPNDLNDGVLGCERYEDGLTVARCYKEIEELVIPSEYMGLPVIRIGNSEGDVIFYEGAKLKRISLPDSLKSIGKGAFRECENLKEITIPDSVTSIGDSAFSGCNGLKSIIIPNNVTSIGIFAFDDCTGLTSIMIPDSVTSISINAFYNDPNITITGKAGSYAEQFAKLHEIPFSAIS